MLGFSPCIKISICENIRRDLIRVRGIGIKTDKLKICLLGILFFNSKFVSAQVASVDAFGQTLHTITKIRCNSCHSTLVAPYHANADLNTAYNAVTINSLVDFVTPNKSKMYTKVNGGHCCWTTSCANDSQSILSQINNWNTLIHPSTSGAVTTTPIDALFKYKMIAYKLYNRLAGAPPVTSILNELATLIASGKEKDAAMRVMDDPSFYNITLKNWVKPWTNIDKTNRVPFNDYVATVIGMIRDNIPFDQVLYGDYLYIAAPGTPGSIPVYDKKNNTQYQTLENNGVNLKDYLIRTSQSQTTGIRDTAGVLTSRATAEAFLSAGTNRRAIKFAFINYACRDLEALHDVDVTDYHVRRDIDRKPGEDSRTYRNVCVGCHAGQDAIGGAYAYFDFVNGQTLYTDGVVVPKINKNNAYPDGWITKDDSWVNTWAQGQNSNLGWPSKVSGAGVRDLGIMLSRTRAFAECMSSKVYELVCLRTPTDDSDLKEMRRLADIFQQDSNFNMKNLIAETAQSCIGE